MTTTDRRKRFDCVAFKRRAQARIYERIKDLTPEEEAAWFRRAAESGPFAEWWRSLDRSADERSATRPPG